MRNALYFNAHKITLNHGAFICRKKINITYSFLDLWLLYGFEPGG